MPDPQYLSTDPNAGQYLSSDPNAGTPIQSTPAQTEAPSGGVGRFVSTAIEEANPITALQNIYQAAKDPAAALASVIASHEAVAQKAKDEYAKGNYQDAAVHALNAVIPLLGPKIDELAERGAKGDWAGLLGGSVGVGASLAGPQVATAGVKALAKVPAILPTAVADAADAASTSRMVDVMSPKVGANKVRFGNMAEKVAPQLAREPDLGAMSRQGLTEAVGSKLSEAGDALDAAAAARNSKLVYHTKPILKDLQALRDKLTAQTVKSGAVKAGEDVTPAPNTARAASIDKAIDEIKTLGPIANFEALRRIRQAWDAPAKAVYSPAMTADYMSKMGEKLGAADVTSVLRDKLASYDPSTAAANARYSLFKAAHDVLAATEETERLRPKVGRQIIAKAAGTAIGGELGGVPGMAAGYFLGPILDAAASSGFTSKIATARMMSSLADAIRSGNPAVVNTKIMQLASMTGQASKVKALLSGQTLSALPVAAQNDQTAPQP
jgi:hypothetical protein